MLTSLSLRLRIFLLFLGLLVASTAVVGGALYLGYQRVPHTDSGPGFLYAAVVSGFGLLAICAGIWLLFDENVAKPIERIAAIMRTRAHADVKATVDMNEARYLGDLAPAVEAVAGQLTKVAAGTGEIVANETAHLAAEKAQLAALLTEIPVAIVLVSSTHNITLYDGQAADILGQIQVPRLNASIFDYFARADLLAAYEKLSEQRTEVLIKVHGTRGNLSFELRLKKLAQTSGYMILIDSTHARISPEAARPLIYDFDLTKQDTEHTLEERPIQGLNFVVFDTETTGLMPNKDEIVQIGAVRVVNGKIVPGEVVDQLVNPGRSIPPASTKVHGISDDMVAGAPDAPTAVSQFHEFAKDSVIVAHNAPFDMAFLQRHGKTSGLAWDHPIMDTVLLSAVLFGASETHTLDAVCDRLDITIPPELRHTALGDAQATAEALCKMLPILLSRDYSTFGDVVRETRKHGRLLQDLN
ncbi:MAG: exonuclease domain-containing protein [Roseibium sp.]